MQVWGCMGVSGVVICHTLVEDGRKLCGTDCFPAGWSTLPAKSTMSWFERKGITVSPWPSQSPDLNPIEHLWEIMKKKRLEKRPCKNMDELKEAIFETWESITSRKSDVIDAKTLHCCNRCPWWEYQVLGLQTEIENIITCIGLY